MTKRTNEEWRGLLAEQRTSGLTQEEWCAANGVNIFTLRDRASRLRKLDGQAGPAVAPVAPTEAAANWVEVKMDAPSVKEPETVGRLLIEVGKIRITTDMGYPVSELAALCRDLSHVEI